MSTRIRTVNKIGKGKYFTSSYKVSDYIFLNILYFIFFYMYYLIFKWFFYKPIKWLVIKMIDFFNKEKKEKST